MSKNIYYVYQYYDPVRKEPIYIGKGYGERYKKHLWPSSLKKKHPFIQRINWIKKQGKEPNILFLYINLPEEKAFLLETRTIKEIGRKDLGKGSLLNLTNGGEGSSGVKPSIKTRIKMRQKQLGKHLSQEHKEKIARSHKGMKYPKEFGEKLRQANLGRQLTQKHKNKIKKSMKAFYLRKRLGNAVLL
jgi:hypothetical protein